MPIPVNLLAPLIAALVVVVAVFILLYAAVLNPAAQVRRELDRRARVEFEAARGAAHLKLMRAARDRLRTEERRERDALSAAEQRKRAVAANRDRALRKALECDLADKRLDDVPGIGYMLALSLSAYVRQWGGVDALRHASGNISGIGPARQAALNAWVDAVEAQMPALLAADFPDKARILHEVEQELASLDAEITAGSERLGELRSQLEQLEQEIEPLAHVTLDAFHQALQQPDAPAEGVERYLRGVFAEWEPVPDWFKEIVGGVAE